MPRGGRTKDRDEPERRCVVTGERGGKAGLVRFVLDPDGVVTPDLAEKLPGRGVWATAERDVIDRAAARGAFARGFKRAVKAPEGFADQVEAGLSRRTTELLSLARKAGLAVCGFERAKAALIDAAALLQAYDGAEDGRAKLRRAAAALTEGSDDPIVVIDVLSKSELGLAFGRTYVIHCALAAGSLSSLILKEAARLRGFRTPTPSTVEQTARSAS